ncbi:hypothetical protein GCM10010399_38250 [Dactylosporangium fulvum]|uniref:DUF4064 domain-containing protein n=1 Tax=Dactylosporangium fulvum TaxID=53359 RepID=A0ABY5W412_9ACTN|nr:hypothetical protein [Dactylosporangium fulvum]UWP84066.1 hypothetical protein Dfulv_07380 [Dactylosporangium fulvum]
MMPPPPNNWTVPPPPGEERPIRGKKVFAGIGLAALGQVAAIGLGVLATFLFAMSENSENALLGIYLEILLQVLLFIACLILGIVWIAQKDRGIGLGLIIGWAVSVLIFPIAGIGVCIAIVNSQGAS